MNKQEGQQLANLIQVTIYIYSNGQHAAQGSTLAAEYHEAGLHVVNVLRPKQ